MTLSPSPPSISGARPIVASLARFIFEHFGLVDAPELHDRYFLHYTSALERKLLEFVDSGKGRLLPGVRQLVEALSTRPSNRLAVATGTASSAQLAATDPDLLFDDFSDLEAVLRGIDSLFPELPNVIPA